MTRLARSILGLALCALMSGCMEWKYTEPEEFGVAGDGLFIVCEGNFQYGNATLTYYDPATNEAQQEVFLRANGYKLGDVANSMAMHDGLGWIVVNNSHVIFAIDPSTFREVGRIIDLPSPRYIHFVSDTKAYVSQIWDNRIFIVNPSTYQITGHIEVPNMTMESGSTEQMVQWGKYVYCNCWSYQNRIIKIDTETDKVVDELTVGVQPRSIALDKNGRLWVLTDGGFADSPYGHEAPNLYRIDAESLQIEKQWTFRLDDSPADLQLNGDGSMLYWINSDVWRMDVEATRLPVKPFLPSQGTIYYGLTVSPANGDVYVADAIDYQQPGQVYRFSEDGELLSQFYAGVIPGYFCWK